MLNMPCRTLLASQIKLLTNKNIIVMYTVYFAPFEPKSSTVEVFVTSKIEDAMQFALMFHRSSNVPHLISVSDGDKESVVFRLMPSNSVEK